MFILQIIKRVVFLGAFLSFVPALSVQAQQQKIYVFGNSLFHHLSDSDTTTVPHWLALLASQQGQRFTLDGEWGFLRNFASNPEPIPNWSFKAVRSGWDSEQTRFSRSGINKIIIVPANFIQWQSPDALYADDGEKISPVEVTGKLMGLVTKARPTAKFYIYEGWAELAGFGNGFPPGPSGMEEYYSYNAGAYHDWYVDYIDGLPKEHTVELIPVATVLSQLLTSTPLDQLTPQDLYLDDAPHGTPTLYFLAAMITYAAIFDSPLPSEFVAPQSVHPVVAKAYSEIANTIPDLLAEYGS